MVLKTTHFWSKEQSALIKKDSGKQPITQHVYPRRTEGMYGERTESIFVSLKGFSPRERNNILCLIHLHM